MRTSMRARRATMATAALCTAALVATSAGAVAAPQKADRRHHDDGARLRNAVTVRGITEHQAKLERIAERNPVDGVPTRVTGSAGHRASVKYVSSTMRAAGFKISLQPFTTSTFSENSASFERVSPDPVTYVRSDGTTGVWSTASFSGNGDQTAAAQAVDFTEPTSTPSASSSGCEASDFGAGVTGKIVLLQRGTCDFGVKVENAQAAGAVGAVIFNEGTIGAPDRNSVLVPSLQGYNATIPVVGTDYATGRHLVDLAAAGPVTLHVAVDGVVENVVSDNVIADSRGGRANRTVVVGAHLDSVAEGPGINDDGSGVSMMLETAQQLHRLKLKSHNHLRFIFFSGEEEGLVGSDYYVSQLTEKQAASISVMLDYDMLASGNYARFVYDGDGSDYGVAGPEGSGTVEQVFSDWWKKKGLAFETIPFDGRSDYDAFTLAGIPAGGIFAGAEEIKTPEQVALYGGTAGIAFDPCYHQACDTLSNISRRGLREHKDAAVHAIWTFATSRASVRPSAKADLEAGATLAPKVAGKQAGRSLEMKGHLQMR
jgi:Zn-dependent M28 family amino/carboxypeptidase